MQSSVRFDHSSAMIEHERARSLFAAPKDTRKAGGKSEFGRPFSAWSKRLAKQANEAFDGALAALASSHSLADGEAAFSEFARRFNALKGIETTERDDLGEAIWQLSSSEHAVRIGVTEELAQQWFDAVRDY